MWRFIDPILSGWEKGLVELKNYKPDSDEISKLLRNLEIPAALNNTPTLSKNISGLKKEIAIIGLGKMGGNIARQLLDKSWRVVGYNRNENVTREMEKEGLEGAYSFQELIKKINPPRLVWLMLTAGQATDEILFGKNGIANQVMRGDTIIDGGNSFYKDSVRRYKKLTEKGINFIDVGFSGGPSGARNGGSLMIGGKKKNFESIELLFHDLSVRDGYQFFEGAGAGHFVKMIHNGIEYGMMQALAEGFAIMKKSKYDLDLSRIAEVYNHGSVVESRLVSWLKDAFAMYSENLTQVSGSVGRTGEGEWTVKTAKELKVKAKIIEEALKFRMKSEKKPSFTGKILSALRNQFGGHGIHNG